jgi:transposase
MSKTKPQPPELLREKAFVLYIITGNPAETARGVKVSDRTIRKWIEEYGWEETRQEHYDLVHSKVLQYLDVEVASKQAELAMFATEKLHEMLAIHLDEAETGSKRDLWQAFDVGVSAVERLLGMARELEEVRLGRQDEETPMINLSGPGQTVYLQALQQIEQETGKGEVIDAENSQNL